MAEIRIKGKRLGVDSDFPFRKQLDNYIDSCPLACAIYKTLRWAWNNPGKTVFLLLYPPLMTLLILHYVGV